MWSQMESDKGNGCRKWVEISVSSEVIQMFVDEIGEEKWWKKEIIGFLKWKTIMYLQGVRIRVRNQYFSGKSGHVAAYFCGCTMATFGGNIIKWRTGSLLLWRRGLDQSKVNR